MSCEAGEQLRVGDGTKQAARRVLCSGSDGMLIAMDEARFAELIRRHLPFYRALAEGRRAPTTEAQRRFVAAARGEIAPTTEHERAFLLWRRRAETAARGLDAEASRAVPIADARERAASRLRLRPSPIPPPPPARR